MKAIKQVKKFKQLSTTFTQQKSYSSKTFSKSFKAVPLFTVGILGVTMMSKIKKEDLIPEAFCELKENFQSTVITGNHEHCAILVVTLKNSSDFEEFVKVASKVPGLISKLSKPKSDDEELPQLMIGVGFDTSNWKNFASKKGLKLPEGFGEYKSRKGNFGDLPHTKYDLILHVKGNNHSLCYESVEEFVKLLPKDKVQSLSDHYGFQYKDGRDLSGFLDGTMNTSGDDERKAAAVNSNGGSFLIHQRWEHNLNTLDKMSLQEQENMVGRKKDWSAEQSQDKMNESAHVKRMRNEKFERIPIVRQSMPFGTVGDKRGLLFIAYSNQVSKFDTMLDRMTDKHSDAIMKYSTNVTGNYYYFPSLEELQSLNK